MSCSSSKPNSSSTLCTCGCCAGASAAPPIYNRPGLPALAYRVGVHSTFYQRILAALSAETFDAKGPPLAGLTTRDSDDPAIALADAWATAADVLTFYQERIANEGFLRTATERRSVLELARTIGYELRPGVAAGAYLAFTEEDAPGAPLTSTVPQGTKVQSIPAQGKLPQVFETSAEITARAEWNALRPRLTQAQALNLDATSFYFTGVTTRLKAGDLLLLSVAGKDPKVVRIKRVTEDGPLNRTRVDTQDIPAPPPAPPVPRTDVTGKITLTQLSFDQTRVFEHVRQEVWRERDLSAFLAIQGWPSREMMVHLSTPPTSAPLPAELGVFAFRSKVGFFGHNAPRHSSALNPPYTVDWDTVDNNKGTTIWTDSTGVTANSNGGVYLERDVAGVLPGGWAVFESDALGDVAFRVDKIAEVSLADYALSGKSTGFTLKMPDGSGPDTKKLDFRVRKTTAFVQSDRLDLADLPIEDPVGSASKSLQLDHMLLGLQVGQPLIVRGERDDLAGVIANEVAILSDIVHGDGYTTLFFESGLQYSYVRKTMTLNANVAPATHGETVREVLASGDAAQSGQRAQLKKPPLTYVSANTASGTDSSLQVRVDGISWTEVARLFGQDQHSRCYIVRINDDGKTNVIFGDGEMGSRVPSGTENVVAVYRSGIGRAGMVDAGSITLLQNRPLGVRGVTNPLPASGAAEPEARDSARGNAPLTVLTLDRIVSLSDFEDFARGFAGIGKAQAIVLVRGEIHFVHVTIAAAAPRAQDTSSLATRVLLDTDPLFKHLVDAISTFRDPSLVFTVASYQPLFFNLRVQVAVDPLFSNDAVFAAVEAALLAAFSFDARGFAQPVLAVEAITVVQSVSGVVACNIQQFYRYKENEKPPDPSEKITADVLPADAATWDAANRRVVPAALLLINPAGVFVEEMKP